MHESLEKFQPYVEKGLFCKKEKLTSSAVFAILDKKLDSLDKMIMRKIRPTGNRI